MWARFTVLNETPIASAIAGCVIPLSRSNTIWMRSRCAAGIFHRSAVFSSRICLLLDLTICPPRIRQPQRIISRAPVRGRKIPQTPRFNQLWKRYKVHIFPREYHPKNTPSGGLNELEVIDQYLNSAADGNTRGGISVAPGGETAFIYFDPDPWRADSF